MSHHKQLLSAFIGITLIFLFALFCYLVYRDIIATRALVERNRNTITTNWWAHGHPHLRHATIHDVDSISSWMTFHYINAIFGLPETYLQTTLPVNDTHYPNLTLQRYSTDLHSNVTTTVANVQAAVRSYLTEHTTTTTP